MTRNLRNELLTAILVLGGLALALGGVFVLSVSAPSEISPTDVPTVVSMVESPVDENPTFSITVQSAISTESQNTTSTTISSPLVAVSATRLTETAQPSSPIAIATNTAIVPLATTGITNTPIQPSATTRITNMPIPASLTTPTSLPPTATDTPIMPSITPRPTNTHTPIPPSATATSTNTAIPPSPTANATTMPIVATNTPAPSGNIPFLSLNPLTAEGCLNPSVQISSPISNNRLSEPFEVIGTATLPNFGVYHIEIRANNALIYQRVATRQQVVYSDVLAEIDPTQYPNGVYWIRLVVVDNRGYITENGTCAIPTIFE